MKKPILLAAGLYCFLWEKLVALKKSGCRVSQGVRVPKMIEIGYFKNKGDFLGHSV